ncbi:hypothetical protein C8R44DRAFT_730264 [Mycena epipterygia]|nr:hypothetical protein C8R44DRAFT_730264 [Mycena epipterygia]
MPLSDLLAVAPLDEIAPHIHHYWKIRKNNKDIVRLLNLHHIDRYFEIWTRPWAFFDPAKQDADIESIRPALLRVRTQYPKVGAREIVSLLFHEENINISRNLVTEYFSVYEPELVKERRKNRLCRKRFWAAGVNDLWAVDQHDKWKYKFGLALHSGIDPFIGRIRWMEIWWTNSNPRLILSYYLDTSDPGNENFDFANGYTLLRHLQDPDLEGTLQHRWMREKKNVMPETGWSQLQHRFMPDFEDILDVGVNNGWYDPNDLVELGVSLGIIPWLQRELDAYRDRLNNTAKRADRNKVLPHGVPNDMYEHPDNYGVLDFKIKVDPEAIDQVRSLYAPTDHEVFQLVPPDFQTIIAEMYINIGEPPVTRETCWNVYLQLLAGFRALDEAHQVPRDIDVEWGYVLTMAGDAHTKDIELMPDLQPLKNCEDVVGPSRSYYMGGVNSGAQGQILWLILSIILLESHRIFEFGYTPRISVEENPEPLKNIQDVGQDLPKSGGCPIINITAVLGWMGVKGHILYGIHPARRGVREMAAFVRVDMTGVCVKFRRIDSPLEVK